MLCIGGEGNGVKMASPPVMLELRGLRSLKAFAAAQKRERVQGVEL